jgi:putative glutamine amidotransferase
VWACRTGGAEAAGGQPVEIPLALPPAKLDEIARSVDAIVLPGSPADVDPGWYHAERAPQCAPADPYREQTDFALLDRAAAERKPVLAICYGVQSLNVYLGGTLVQDISSEMDTPIKHDWDSKSGEPEPHHEIAIETGTELARLVGVGADLQIAARGTVVNSSHHQSIARPGRGLRISGRAPDGVIEAVESIASGQWIVGAQWHPERAPQDPLTQALFSGLMAAARRVAV